MLNVRAPKTVWGMVAALLFYLDASPELLAWIPENIKPAVDCFIKLGSVGATFLIGTALPRPEFIKKQEQEKAKEILEEASEIKKPAKKRVVKKKTITKTP